MIDTRTLCDAFSSSYERPLSLRPIPTVGGDIEHNAVGIPKLVFGIRRGSSAWAGMKFSTVGFDFLLRPVDVVDPETEVMQPDEILAALIARIILVAKLKQSQVHHPVREACGNLRFRHSLEPESILVKFRGLFLVGNGDRDMSKLCFGHNALRLRSKILWERFQKRNLESARSAVPTRQTGLPFERQSGCFNGRRRKPQWSCRRSPCHLSR